MTTTVIKNAACVIARDEAAGRHLNCCGGDPIAADGQALTLDQVAAEITPLSLPVSA